MRSLLAIALLATGVSAQMTALVNDPMSHGTLGDSKLSLDEAIRIMNSALAYGSLSAAEQAQLRGAPTFILDTIEVDAAITPKITLEKQLTDIIGDTVAHVDCNFYGLNGRPVIDGATNNIAEVFPSRTNHFHLVDFVVRGGQTAITYDTSLHYHPGEIFIVDNCLFEGQTKMGIEVRVPQFPPGGIQPGVLTDTVFRGLPIGIQMRDQGLSGDTDLDLTGIHFDGCASAFEFSMGGFGGTVDVTMDRSLITGATTGVSAVRSGGSDSTLTLDLVHDTIVASGSALDFAGDLIGGTVVRVYHSNVRGGVNAGDFALRTTPASGRFDVIVAETVLDGDVELQSGRFGTTLEVRNSALDNGAMKVTTTGPGAVLWRNRHRSAPLTVAASTTKAVAISESELIRSNVTDQTAGGVTTMDRCLVASATVSGNITPTNAAAQPWIGTAAVTPTNPRIGAYIDLSVDLAPDTAAAWMFGLASVGPVNLLAPLNLYIDLSVPSLTLPGLYGGQRTLRLPLPNNAALQGVEFYAQPLLVPTAAQSPAPAFSLPRGGRIAVQ